MGWHKQEFSSALIASIVSLGSASSTILLTMMLSTLSEFKCDSLINESVLSSLIIGTIFTVLSSLFIETIFTISFCLSIMHGLGSAALEVSSFPEIEILLRLSKRSYLLSAFLLMKNSG